MPWRWSAGVTRHLVDIELGRPQVGMAMHHGRHLAHDLALGDGHDEMMARRAEIMRQGGAVDGIDRTRPARCARRHVRRPVPGI